MYPSYIGIYVPKIGGGDRLGHGVCTSSTTASSTSSGAPVQRHLLRRHLSFPPSRTPYTSLSLSNFSSAAAAHLPRRCTHTIYYTTHYKLSVQYTHLCVSVYFLSRTRTERERERETLALSRAHVAFLCGGCGDWVTTCCMRWRRRGGDDGGGLSSSGAEVGEVGAPGGEREPR